MKSAHIRVLVVLAIATLIGIVSTQLYWLNRAIEQQDKVFNHNVHVALQNVVESLCEAKGKDYPAINPIQQVSNNYYIVRTNDQIDLANLEYLITAEISKRAITEAFDYGVYDCQSDKMVFAENVNIMKTSSRSELPILENQEYYFGVYFPEKSQSIIAELDLWKFTTVLTIVVIVFFGYALFVILRQRRLSEIQKDFINNVSHELKTPLATLSLASDSLSQNSRGRDKYIQIIVSEVDRLKRSVNGILDASVSESRNDVEREHIDIGQTLVSITEELKKQYTAHMLEWRIEVEATSLIKSSTSLIENIVKNIVDNAVKYGGKTIVIKANEDRKNTFITISDDGPGVPEEHRKKIFKKFYRVPENKDQHNVKGFGLGLHIVKTCVKKLGGEIHLVSKEGKGCSFNIKLPNG